MPRSTNGTTANALYQKLHPKIKKKWKKVQKLIHMYKQ